MQSQQTKLIIDTREIKLIECLRQISISFEVANLLIGDIILQHTLQMNERMITYEIIIERKCIQDMIASIKDGRYKEQKIRLQAEHIKNNNNNQRQIIIAYILEGTLADLRLPADKNILLGSIVSSIFRDKIPILRTYSLQETTDLIMRIYERLNKDVKDFFNISNTHNITLTPITPITDESISNKQQPNLEQPNLEQLQNNKINTNSHYLAVIKKNKKDNMTPTMWNINCLCGIPGVSTNIAIKIAEKYPTLKNLLEAYQSCTDLNSRETLLANIFITESDKQRRRLGNVISKRIYEYFQI